jgi:hypothetical protein
VTLQTSVFGKLVPLLFLATATTPQQDLLRLLNTEKANYSLLTYSQRYLDKDNNPVDYTGTLYLKLESFSLNNCVLTIDIVVQDRYIGTEEKRKHFRKIEPLPLQQSSTYSYSYRIDLKDTVELQADFIEGRPSQLLKNTGFVCKENSGCNLQWLHLKTSNPAIREKRESDGFMDFQQSVKTIEIPMSSRDTALQMATSIEHLTETCH